MQLLYYSTNIKAQQSHLESVLAESGAGIELLPASTEHDFLNSLSQADIVIIQGKDFERLLLQIVSQAEQAPKRKKLAVLKEPKQFNNETVSTILKQLYSNNIALHFPIKNGEVELATNEILYFEYADRFVYIKTEQNYIKTTLKLRDVPAFLTGCSFASPYVSFIVNLMYVEAVTGNSVLLKNGKEIPLSQKKAAEFRKEYKRYLSIMS